MSEHWSDAPPDRIVTMPRPPSTNGTVAKRPLVAGFVLRIDDVTITLCDDPEIVVMDRGGEGGEFSLREFADVLHNFISERL